MENGVKENLAKEYFKGCIPLFTLLADEQRQQILILLGQEKMNVTQLTKELSLSRPAVSHHLKLLKQAGLIDREKRGKESYYYLTLKEALDLLEGFTKHLKDHCEVR